MLTRYIAVTIIYEDGDVLPIGDIAIGTRAISSSGADDTKKQYNGIEWIDGWSESWIATELDRKLNKDSSDTMNGSLTVTNAVEIAGAASAVRLVNIDHAYVYGVAPDGSNGWYFGRGSGGSYAVTCANYHGSTFQLPQGGGLTLDGDDVFYEGNSISEATGGDDSGKNVVLNNAGQIDPSLLDASVFHYVGAWDPSDPDGPADDNSGCDTILGCEYPDINANSFGDFWVIADLLNPEPPIDPADPDERPRYIFTTGDLIGFTIKRGDFMVWGTSGWSIMRGEMNPLLYYRLDGSQALTDDFQAGTHKLVNVVAGTADTDAATYSQVKGKVNKSGDTMSGNLKIGTSQRLAELSIQNNGDASNNGPYSSLILRDNVGNPRATFYAKNDGYVAFQKQAASGAVAAEYELTLDGTLRSHISFVPADEMDLTPKKYVDDGLAGKEPANSNIQAHIADVTSNPHNVTYAMLPDVPDEFPPAGHNHNSVYNDAVKLYNAVDGYLIKTGYGFGGSGMATLELTFNNYSNGQPTTILVQAYFYQADSIIQYSAIGTTGGLKPEIHVFYDPTDGKHSFWVQSLGASITMQARILVGYNLESVTNAPLPAYTIGGEVVVEYASMEGHTHSQYSGWQSRGSGVATGFDRVKIAEVSNTLEDAWELKCVFTHKEKDVDPVEDGYAEVFIQKPAGKNIVTIYNKNFWYVGSYGIYYVEVRDLETHYEIWLDLVSTTDIEDYTIYSNYSNQPGSITVLPTGVEVTDTTPVELGDIYIPYLYAHNNRDSWYGSLSGNASSSSRLLGSTQEYDILPDDTSNRGSLALSSHTEYKSDYWLDPAHPTDSGEYVDIMAIKSYEPLDLTVTGMSALVFDRNNGGKVNLWQANYGDEVWVDKGQLEFKGHTHSYEPVVTPGADGQVWTSRSGAKVWEDLPDPIVDHGNLTGLGDDDHTQYLLIDGTRAMTGDFTLAKGKGVLVDFEGGTKNEVFVMKGYREYGMFWEEGAPDRFLISVALKIMLLQ